MSSNHFYNGKQEEPEKEMLKLSEAFSIKESNPMLKLKAEFININPGNNTWLLNACRTLKDYSEYTFRVRKYAQNMEIEDAVENLGSEKMAAVSGCHFIISKIIIFPPCL